MFRKFLNNGKEHYVAFCKCGQPMVRAPKGPTTQVMERLDNGSMVQTLERYSDAERIFQERHDNADELAGTRPNRS